jgi:hypothetical protein
MAEGVSEAEGEISAEEVEAVEAEREGEADGGSGTE